MIRTEDFSAEVGITAPSAIVLEEGPSSIAELPHDERGGAEPEFSLDDRDEQAATSASRAPPQEGSSADLAPVNRAARPSAGVTRAASSVERRWGLFFHNYLYCFTF